MDCDAALAPDPGTGKGLLGPLLGVAAACYFRRSHISSVQIGSYPMRS
jgi:hypothetical protein